jgi:hypothetical protein
VGSLGEHKGIDLLLRAFGQVHAARPALRLRLVGDERSAGDMARWLALAAGLGVGGAVTFEGWLDRSGVAGAMARASVFVHPSPAETFGVVAAEAILSGLPVVSRRSGGVPWIIELSGGFGAVAASDDEAAFAAAIETVLDGDPPVAPFDARTALVAEVGRAAVAARTLAIYRDAIGEAATVASPEAAGIEASGLHPTPNPGEPASPATAAAPPEGPHIVIATGRDQALRLVAELPVDLQRRVVLVVPPPSDDVPPAAPGSPPGNVRLIEAARARYERPPSGRSPLSRLKRATWQPPLTADEELVMAIRRAIAEVDRGAMPVELVALDAPAAAMVASLDPTRVRLAPGSLRWLADRWDSRTTKVQANGL